MSNHVECLMDSGSPYLLATPDALIAIGMLVQREWGYNGYAITYMLGYRRGAIAKVRHNDGSVFYVGSDGWGNTAHGDTAEAVTEQLLAKAVAL